MFSERLKISLDMLIAIGPELGEVMEAASKLLGKMERVGVTPIAMEVSNDRESNTKVQGQQKLAKRR